MNEACYDLSLLETHDRKSYNYNNPQDLWTSMTFKGHIEVT